MVVMAITVRSLPVKGILAEITGVIKVIKYLLVMYR